MRSKFLVVVLSSLACVQAQQWQAATPDYAFEFPRDHFSHPRYQTEWWYYTGNVHAPDGRRFGFELTFFRSAVKVPDRALQNPVWAPDQIYLAHLALSDIDGKRFYHEERMNRAGPGLAGADFAVGRCWNGNWQVRWTALPGAAQRLQAASDQVRLTLALWPEKPMVIQGEHGVSVKGPLAGEASHYLSFTRLHAAGEVTVGGKALHVDGLAWMDHEFFTEPPDNTLVGWDWFSIQLSNREELMLYRLRRRGGGPDPYSSGTFVDGAGQAHHLQASDFTLSPAGTWRSGASRAVYPTDWSISVPSLQLSLKEHTALDDQELLSQSGATPSYWEGAVSYSGTRGGSAVSGLGYLEMTGYGRPVWLGAK